MRKITPITFDFLYLDTQESKERLSDAYRRIFRTAWKNLVDKQNIPKYTKDQYDKSTKTGGIPDNRRASIDPQGDKSDTLPDGAERENPSGEVR